MKVVRHTLRIDTGPGIGVHDLTAQIRAQLADSGIAEGFVTVTSRHTTTALTRNENEARLIEDLKSFLARLVPADAPYLHNDIARRDCPPDEPENAHAHIIAMLLGSSEVIPVSGGALELGTYQSLLLVELDGPRPRTVGLQIIGA